MDVVAGRWALERRLGEGAVGETFLARDLIFGERVALKLLRPSVPIEPLRREFLALRELAHPRLVAVRGFGVARGRAWLACAHVDGTTLDTWAPGRSAEEVDRVIVDVLDALSFLHARGVVHGDVTASNVVVAGGRATLVDLGCARAPGRYSDVYGTPDHLAPEARRGEVSQASDLYSLGVALDRLGIARPIVDRMRANEPASRPSADEAMEALGHASSSRFVARRGARVGLDDLLGRVSELVERLRADDDGPRTLFIRGPHGSGRTRAIVEARWAAEASVDLVESNARQAGAIRDLVGRAAGEATPSGRARMLDVATRLAQRDAPIVLCLDDADALTDDDARDLDALLRALPPRGRLGVILAGAAEIAASALVEHALPPWDDAAIARFLGEAAPASGIARLRERSGGLPREIVRIAGELPAALLTAEAVERRARVDLAATPAETRVLATIAASRGALSEDAATTFGLDRDAIVSLIARGLVEREGPVLRLSRALDRTRLPDRALHRSLAELSRSAGDRAFHLARADESRAAGEVLRGAEELLRTRPHALLAAAEAIDPREPDDAWIVARVFEACGDPVRALTIVSRALRGRPSDPWPGRLRRVGAACALRRGEARKAVARLRAALESEESPEIAADLAIALLRMGAYGEALAVIARAIDSAEPGTRAELLITRAFAESYLGRDADRSLAEVDRIDPLPARTRFRHASARAFVALRHGRSREASTGYQRALSIAEDASLDDLIVPAALNAGTAAHQAGDFGAALRAYERGQQLAHAFGAISTAITLDFNLAKLLSDVGAFERAEVIARRALGAIEHEGMAFLRGVTLAVVAEIAQGRGDLATARAEISRALPLLEAEGATREVLEVELQRVEIDLDLPIDPLIARARALPAIDLEARARRVRALAHLRKGDASAAVAELEAAAGLARETGQDALLADIAATLGDAWEASGSRFLADGERTRARELWERASTGLPSALRAPFRAHPNRRKLLAEVEVRSGSREVERLRHLIAINRRISSATTTSAVLEATIDAAIELGRAERGFLLLREERGHRVAVARNLDRERIGRSQLKFSREIARRVVETGESVVAIDAEGDPRFTSSRSVHAMRLKSILCVPVQGSDGTIGALYLDHRFRAGAFADDDVEIVRAFADQAAIALTRARLVDELRTKNEKLEAERTAIARVAEGRAAEIERLEQTLRAAPRHPYEEIVGRGPAMARMLDLVDRVVEADVTVLVQGESGTGKELIARAIHRYGARREAPFRAINCGALPEALLEAELFGYRKGAFTGAARDHDGLFVSARGGTVFLDELGEMPLAMQVKLLRVLQEREVRPLGATASVPIDVRLVCATNRDLRAEVAAGRFREDLYFRVAVMTITTPPLRERIEDLPALVDVVLDRAARVTKRSRPRLDRGAERALLQHGWPGNVRELENVLTKALLMCDGAAIREEDLALMGAPPIAIASKRPRGGAPHEAVRFRAVLEATGWNVCEAARTLEIPRATFYRKLRRYGLDRPS
jgi:serine/threonine-protein kinase PknK